VGSNGSGPVFVDLTGRRRRLVTALGIGAGLALVAAIALLVAGVLGASPVPLPGLPRGGQGAQQGTVVPAELLPSTQPPGPATSPPARPPSVAPSTSSAATPAPTPPTASSAAPTHRGNKPTDKPGNGRPSRSK
jgi:hypothetical protein